MKSRRLTSCGGLSRVDVADDNDVDMGLFFTEQDAKSVDIL